MCLKMRECCLLVLVVVRAHLECVRLCLSLCVCVCVFVCVCVVYTLYVCVLYTVNVYVYVCVCVCVVYTLNVGNGVRLVNHFADLLVPVSAHAEMSK